MHVCTYLYYKSLLDLCCGAGIRRTDVLCTSEAWNEVKKFCPWSNDRLVLSNSAVIGVWVRRPFPRHVYYARNKCVCIYISTTRHKKENNNNPSHILRDRKKKKKVVPKLYYTVRTLLTFILYTYYYYFKYLLSMLFTCTLWNKRYYRITRLNNLIES